ncbi:hypothetical protein AK95_03200 [Paenibacillus sp. LC231]|uniref:Uncharacterized protein n=1 Tax=Paenibacillus glucanolyticus TaxID=59843 RepID=A0A168EXK1_9BACL|nr:MULTISPECIES: hypothetical protein [Paenibacillus]KZS44917.1 hypothetical protein AWU65_02730 [Paenibacillus glucanolyticus]OIB01923.1 hypothetical protein AK95_03200 [Paenibacillus sp. LC231]OMF65507.1 hypothetical protein BK142_30635 [Paenibacillus glucanolyticus]
MKISFLKFYKLMNFMAWVFPFFVISDDDNFGTLEEESRELRFSFLTIKFGDVIYYFLSIGFWYGDHNEKAKFPKGFRFMYSLRVSQYKREYNTEKINDLKTKHIAFLRTKDSEELSVYKETLLYKLDQIKEKSTKTTNKFLAYLAIIAFLIPLYIPGALRIGEVFDKPMWLVIAYIYLAGYLAYNLINFVKLFFRFVQVKPYAQFKYSMIKNSSKPNIDLLTALYIEYQLRDNESVEEVSFIKNIDGYMKSILLISSFLLVFDIIFGSVQAEEKIKPPVSPISKVFHLDLSQSSKMLFTDQFDVIKKFGEDLVLNKVTRITLIRTGDAESDNYNRIVQIITSYNINKAEIIQIQDKPNDMSASGHLQIIVERR